MASDRTTFVLLCNGAARPRRRGRAPVTQNLMTFGGAKNVRLLVADITNVMGQKLPPEVLDLLELATLVYAADQCCRRTPGRRFDYGLRWHRDLRFHVAVRRPEFWGQTAVRDALVETLHFLTDDDYEFTFDTMAEPPGVQEYLDYGPGSPPPPGVDQVMLLSGGLDSLAGAAEQVLHERRRLAMVSHKPVRHLAVRQRSLVESIGERAKDRRLAPFHIPVTAHKVGLEDQDFTQRSRSFLYASIGAAVALLFGLDEVCFYENGIVSVNLPLCAQEVGGRATRTTHPQVLRGFERVFSLVLGRPFRVPNGYFWRTKQEVLQVLQRYQQADLARTSVSCSHTRTITGPAPHCGMCSQCLSRRMAALGADYGQNDPLGGYRKDPLTAARTKDEERILAERFIGSARAVSRMTAVNQFARQYAGKLSRVIPYLNMPLAVAADQLFDLHYRHAEQVREAIVGQIASHADDRWQGTLIDTSALAYAFGGAMAGQPAPEAIENTPTGGAAHDEAAAGLVIDESTFTVSMGGRECVFREKSKQQFALMARIGQRPGLRVWFDQLREAGNVWNGAVVEDETIRGAVSRLKKKLRGARLRQLADAISTGTYQSRSFVILDLHADKPLG